MGIKRNSGMKWDAAGLNRDRDKLELWNSIKECIKWILKWIPLELMNLILYATLNEISLSSTLLHGASMNPILHWNDPFWIQRYLMDFQWFYCCVD